MSRSVFCPLEVVFSFLLLRLNHLQPHCLHFLLFCKCRILLLQLHPVPPSPAASLTLCLRYLFPQLSFFSSSPCLAYHASYFLIFSNPFLLPSACSNRCYSSVAALHHISVTFIPFFSRFLPSLHLPPVDPVSAPRRCTWDNFWLLFILC